MSNNLTQESRKRKNDLVFLEDSSLKKIMLIKAQSNEIEYKDTIKQINKIKRQVLKKVNDTEKCLTMSKKKDSAK